MLAIHLSMLVVTSMVPGEYAGVTIKKVCLKKDSQKSDQIIAGKLYDSSRISKLPESSGDQEKKSVEVICSVKLLCTRDSEVNLFTQQNHELQTIGFIKSIYLSPGISFEPDPPRLS